MTARTAPAGSSVIELRHHSDDGDDITVARDLRDGSATTVCSNGTTTRFEPDGSSRSKNDPLGGVPVVVEIDPDGRVTTQYPDGVTERVEPDGTRTVTEPDGPAATHYADGAVTYDGGAGAAPRSGYSLQRAVDEGRVRDVNVIATGENVGTVAVVEVVSDGDAGGVLFVPASLVVPDDPAAQTLATRPALCPLEGPGTYTIELDGSCHADPAKPPPPSGATALHLEEVAWPDPSLAITNIVTGAVDGEVIPADLVGNRDDTIQTLDQITRWMRGGADDEVIASFLIPRFPSEWTEEEQDQKVGELCDWGHRLVSKTVNLGKQHAAEPPDIPPYGEVIEVDAHEFIDDAPVSRPSPADLDEMAKAKAAREAHIDKIVDWLKREHTKAEYDAMNDTLAKLSPADWDNIKHKLNPPRPESKAKNPDGSTTTTDAWSYDGGYANAPHVSKTDYPNGVVVHQFFDGLKRWTVTVYPDGRTVTSYRGKTVTTYPDGRIETVVKRKHIKVTQYPDGHTTVEPWTRPPDPADAPHTAAGPKT